MKKLALLFLFLTLSLCNPQQSAGESPQPQMFTSTAFPDDPEDLNLTPEEWAEKQRLQMEQVDRQIQKDQEQDERRRRQQYAFLLQIVARYDKGTGAVAKEQYGEFFCEVVTKGITHQNFTLKNVDQLKAACQGLAQSKTVDPIPLDHVHADLTQEFEAFMKGKPEFEGILKEIYDINSMEQAEDEVVEHTVFVDEEGNVERVEEKVRKESEVKIPEQEKEQMELMEETEL